MIIAGKSAHARMAHILVPLALTVARTTVGSTRTLLLPGTLHIGAPVAGLTLLIGTKFLSAPTLKLKDKPE